MSLRDANGYPLQGIDVVPERPKPSKMAQLVKLLREANRREEKANDEATYWRDAYHRLNQDYIALQFEDMCSDCKRVKDGTDPGETYTLCGSCHKQRETVRTLTRKLEELLKEKDYWQDCYETALKQFSDFPDGQYDGGSHDDPHPRV